MVPPALAKKISTQKEWYQSSHFFASCHLLSMCASSGGLRTAWRPEHLGRRAKALCDRGRISDQNLVRNSSEGHVLRRYARASCAQRPLNPRSGFLTIGQSGSYPTVRKKYNVPRGSETSFEELDTSGVDWRYLPCPQRPRSHCNGKSRCEIAQTRAGSY